MAFHWVNLGDTYKEVKEHSFLWSPQFKTNDLGKKTFNAGWSSVANVKKNDIIFCYADGYLIYVVVAKKDTYAAERPKSRAFKVWDDEGYRVDVEFFPLEQPINIREIKDDLQWLLDKSHKPKLFDVNGKVCQFYLAPISNAAGSYLLELTDKIAELVDNEVYCDSPPLKGEDIIVKSKARKGQGKFREQLLSFWNKKCALTGVDEPSLLIASHIVPWNLSTPEEKVDKFNGLLLAPHIDKLFDKGFVSFDDNGSILLHRKLSIDTLKKLGVREDSKLKTVPEQCKTYLKRHRELYRLSNQ